MSSGDEIERVATSSRPTLSSVSSEDEQHDACSCASRLLSGPRVIGSLVHDLHGLASEPRAAALMGRGRISPSSRTGASPGLCKSVLPLWNLLSILHLFRYV